MGWDSSNEWTKKSDIITHLKRSMFLSNWEIIADKSTVDGYWAAVKNPNGERFIFFGLIQGLSLKTMDESMGPSYYSCPVHFFDLVDAPKGYAVEWREKVKQAAERKTRKLETGMKIELYGKKYTVKGPHKATFSVVDENGVTYKLTRKQLSQWNEVTKLEEVLK
jgi:hypothetical protein